MRVLHEQVLSRIATLAEVAPPGKGGDSQIVDISSQPPIG